MVCFRRGAGLVVRSDPDVNIKPTTRQKSRSTVALSMLISGQREGQSGDGLPNPTQKHLESLSDAYWSTSSFLFLLKTMTLLEVG